MRKSLSILTASLAMLFILLPSVLPALDTKVMTTYHDNGKLKERYSYFSDEWGSIWKHGPYASWDYVGHPDVLMEFSYNSRQGPYTRYIYDWQLNLSSIEQGTYEGSSKVGTWTITPVQIDGPQGSYEYAVSGNVLIRQREQQKYQNGNPKFEQACELKNRVWLCVWTDYYSSDSGKVKAVSRMEPYPGWFAWRVEGRHLNGTVSYAGIRVGADNPSSGRLEGRWNYWADDGFLIQQTDYVDGKKHGLEIVYAGWEISKVKDKGIREFRYGIQQGDEKGYDEAGNLKYHHRYVDGMQEGEQRDYWGSVPGKLWMKYFMKGGIKEGLQEMYYKSGTLQSRGQFVGGKIEGLWEQFHENGTIFFAFKLPGGKSARPL